jgi:hypothetical protein
MSEFLKILKKFPSKMRRQVAVRRPREHDVRQLMSRRDA